MAKDEGYVSLHRKIRSHWIWNDRPFSKGQAWIDMLMKANHKENKFPFKDKIINISRGQFSRTERGLADIERMKNRPPDDQGFTCYCPKCEEPYESHKADPETGLIYCYCGEEFEPEE